MQIILYVIILVFLKQEIFVMADNNHIDTLVHHISMDSKVYQVTILTNNKSVNTLTNYLITEEISYKIPTLTVNLDQISDSSNFRYLQSEIFGKHSSTLYIFLENEDKEESSLMRMSNVIHKFIEFSPYIPKPKLLMVSINNKVLFEINLRKLFLKAWSLKVLDFSILNLRDEPILYTYNPFTKKLINQIFDAAISLFPKKYDDVNNYPIKVGIFHYPPYINVSHSKDTDELKVTGVNYPFLRIMIESLKFSIKLVMLQIDTSDVTNLISDIEKALASTKMHVIPIKFLLSTDLHSDNYTRSILLEDAKYVFLVPILYFSKFDVPIDVLLVVSVAIIIISIIGITEITLNLLPNKWNVFDVFQLSLGISLIEEPKKLAHRIIYLKFVILSMLYTSGAFSKILDINIAKEEVAFDTVENIEKSNLPVYAPQYFRGFNGKDETLEQLKPFVKVEMDQNPCLERLVKYKNCICFVPYTFAETSIYEYGKTHDVQVMKMAKPKFQHDKLVFLYDVSSPFTEKFDEVLQRIYESGIPSSVNFNEQMVKFKKSFSIKEISFTPMLMVVVTGWFISIGVFLIEIIYELISLKKCQLTIL